MGLRSLPIDRPFRLLFVLMIAGLTYALTSQDATLRLDHLVYDTLLSWSGHRAHDDVVIVAIDDASLQRLGRWPWSRRRHAELLDRLTSAGPKAVGFDILFSEPQLDDRGADAAFASALRRSGRTVLAVAPTQPSNGAAIDELLPVPSLGTAAARLGHVDIEIDADGLCRSFFTHAGIGDAHWPAFAIALLKVGGEAPSWVDAPRPGQAGEGWVRHGRHYVPFDATQNALATISAADVLGDPDVLDRLRDRYILVGSTATGLGDVVSTPVSFNHQRMPGVELNGHILSGLLSGRVARDVAAEDQQVFSLFIAMLGATLLLTTGFATGVFLVFSTIALALLVSATLLINAQLWFGPAAAILALLIGFPLWGIWTVLREKRINRELTARMHYQALHHATTELPNQYLLDQRLRALATKDRALSFPVALLIVHINWAESVGQPFSNAMLDLFLRAVAERLGAGLHDADLIAHLSGDDFAILIDPVDDTDAAVRVGEQVMQRLQQPFDIEGTATYLSPRIGMSIWPRDGADGAALLRNAYIATFRARIEKATTPCAYSAEIAREVEARAQLERALSSAVDHGELEVYYQPQINAQTGRIVGVEALLRWHNPDLGLVYPSTFIPVAEHTGLIKHIGRWVLLTACDQVQAWNRQGLGPLRLAVNLSPLQFVEGDLSGDIEDALEHSGIDPGLLELEITESALMQDLRETRRLMQAFRRRGVKLAIDDFGTGYSSLSHLQHFPFDRIKIDQSFTRDLEVEGDVREITATIITMAKRLRRTVIAEGVETTHQQTFLVENGCDELQGFLISRPAPAEDIQVRLERELADSPPAASDPHPQT